MTSAAAMSAAIDAVCRVLTQAGTGVELVGVVAVVGVEETTVEPGVDAGAVELTAETTPNGMGRTAGWGIGSWKEGEAAATENPGTALAGS